MWCAAPSTPGKGQDLYSYIVDVKLAEKKKEETAVKKADSRNIQIETEARYRYPAHGKEVLKDRPVIIGAGPAGLFAALALAENGFAPLLLEQGDPVEVRAEKVEAFWRNGDDTAWTSTQRPVRGRRRRDLF